MKPDRVHELARVVAANQREIHRQVVLLVRAQRVAEYQRALRSRKADGAR